MWTAKQQKWWYEITRGSISAVAVRCRSCRQKERLRKAEARRVHLKGLAEKHNTWQADLRRLCSALGFLELIENDKSKAHAMNNEGFPAHGKCACGEVVYTLRCKPMIVHCCHCTWCQRETGAAFALNALVESDHLVVEQGRVERIKTPSNSGFGQVIVRCTTCEVALWSHYGAAKEKVAFLRVGTLDNPNLCPPDIHIFTSSKQSWVALDDAAVQFDEFYRRSEQWPEGSVRRYKAAIDA